MRLSLFLALIVATFVASCVDFSSAENVDQISDNGDNQVRFLKGSRQLATADEWWLEEDDGEERIGGGFISKMRGRISTRQAAGGVAKTEKLSSGQVQTISREVTATVKKDRKAWPVIKKGLKILYGSTLSALIVVGVTAMLSE